MKQDRNVELNNLASNLELILKNKNEKMIAFTSDVEDRIADNLINDLVTIFKKNKKVLVLSYKPFLFNNKNVDSYVLNDKTDTKEDIIKKVENYDFVLVNCPNMVKYCSYLHMKDFVKEVIIVAKQWKSRTENIKKIKDIILENDMDFVGVVYQK